ncbi:MAG: hypothetical protein GWN16_01050 [Calditrichae bacterium]|nr:hypothetical protein [Calditrichia bacterium]NIW78113.1 hypothetical protein [Calditrichia bacterium]
MDLAEDHHLVIDPYLLDIVIRNLLRNAISYGTPEQPIRIRTTSDALTVSNYGSPLDISEGKLFERFYRNHKQRASLGLGLSLVKKICDINNLQIDYQYNDGQHLFTIRVQPNQ